MGCAVEKRGCRVAFSGRIEHSFEIGGVVSRRRRHGEHRTRLRVDDDACAGIPFKRLLGSVLDGRVDGQHDVVARLRDSRLGVEHVEPACEVLLAGQSLVFARLDAAHAVLRRVVTHDLRGQIPGGVGALVRAVIQEDAFCQCGAIVCHDGSAFDGRLFC